MARKIQKLTGKNIALIFEKDSTRTRCSFEVAATDPSARDAYLGPSGSQIGHKESIKDTARVLGMYGGVRPATTARKWSRRTVRGRAGVEQADQRVPPDATAGGPADRKGTCLAGAFNEMTLVYAGDGGNGQLDAGSSGADRAGSAPGGPRRPAGLKRAWS